MNVFIWGEVLFPERLREYIQREVRNLYSDDGKFPDRGNLCKRFRVFDSVGEYQIYPEKHRAGMFAPWGVKRLSRVRPSRAGVWGMLFREIFVIVPSFPETGDSVF